VAVRATTDVTDHGVRTLAADGAVLVDGEVVLLRRDHPPFEGTWVLPGGMVERGERAATACVREVEEETGLDVRVVEFLGLYDAPDRDPRGVVSAAYLCRAVGDGEPRTPRRGRRHRDVPARGHARDGVRPPRDRRRRRRPLTVGPEPPTALCHFGSMWT
jgi:8-oxo-dGTP diphosphatase